MSVIAFSPGYISCIFQPHWDEDPLRTGSRGLGFCIDRGAIAKVEDAKWLSVTVNEEEAPVTRRAIEIIGVDDVEVSIKTQLPISQGFAMSAAGTLAACIAVCRLRNIPIERGYRAAHIAEVSEGGGMGDVAGIITGGASLRTKAGLPPWGKVQKSELEGEILLAVVDDPLPTKTVIRDDEAVRQISAAAERALGSLSLPLTWESVLKRSRDFAEEAGVMSLPVRKALELLSEHGEGSMCMLGNSIFLRGAIEHASERWPGKSWICAVDKRGPRFL